MSGLAALGIIVTLVNLVMAVVNVSTGRGELAWINAFAAIICGRSTAQELAASRYRR